MRRCLSEKQKETFWTLAGRFDSSLGKRKGSSIPRGQAAAILSMREVWSQRPLQWRTLVLGSAHREMCLGWWHCGQVLMQGESVSCSVGFGSTSHQATFPFLAVLSKLLDILRDKGLCCPWVKADDFAFW